MRMQLIGYMDSPFVRRVALTMEFLQVAYEHRELSIFRNFDEFRAINPLVKVPTLVLDSGEVLVDSSLIIAYIETQVAKRSLMPSDPAAFRAATRQIGVALVAMEKVAALIYEIGHRPSEFQHRPWIDRLRTQLGGAVALMESAVPAQVANGNDWLFGPSPGQADISVAVAWAFIQHVDEADIPPEDYPGLVAFSARAEALPEFLACPISG
jgi:glutathione S-transferase